MDDVNHPSIIKFRQMSAQEFYRLSCIMHNLRLRQDMLLKSLGQCNTFISGVRLDNIGKLSQEIDSVRKQGLKLIDIIGEDEACRIVLLAVRGEPFNT